MPPTRPGSTLRVASTFRPAACSICFRIASASASVSSRAVVSSTLSPRHQPLELLRDLLELSGPALLGHELEEVGEERLLVAREVGEDGGLRARLELRVAEHCT
jgi:hypothetical protein